RARKQDARRVNADTSAALARGDVVAVFPEGRTTDGHDVLPFKSSLLQPIVDARGHVQPVAIRYRAATGETSVLPAYVGNLSLLASLWRITAAPSLIVDLHAPPRLAAAETSHRRELARAAETAIRMALAEAPATLAPNGFSGPVTVGR
ncbi:MAG TPA: 1-acyl-sn-glycerol-3-phosphate acyltransferase, partial [Casimicrobiaceae bacterium]|nr:1-acyl-sn-glycerol-3-phosphate acyltransferase [Casimicrobiaceae bacterium]